MDNAILGISVSIRRVKLNFGFPNQKKYSLIQIPFNNLY